MALSRLFIFTAAALVLFVGCKPADRKKESEENNSEIVDEAGFQRGDKPIYYRFPSAREMLSYIKTDELTYRTDLVNPTENISQYTDTRAKTLNLGVYLTDFSYMIIFGRTKKTREYFDAIIRLTSDLRISIPEEKEILNRISANLHNTDSLIAISETYQSHVIDYLVKTEKEKTLAVISTGSYIEGLYIGLELIRSFGNNRATINKIAEQKYAFNNLLHFAENYHEDINARYSIQCLKQINQHFKEFSVDPEKTKVRQVDSNRWVFKGGDKIRITRKQYLDLKETVGELRSGIVTNKMKCQ
jgi:hypothetical protein